MIESCNVYCIVSLLGTLLRFAQTAHAYWTNRKLDIVCSRTPSSRGGVNGCCRLNRNQLDLVFHTTMYASVKQGFVTSLRDISSSLELSQMINFEIVIRISESSTLHQYRPFWLHIHFACTFLLQVCAETTLATSTYHSCSWQQPLRLRVSSRILLGL